MPRETKADRILSEARQRAQDAQAKVQALDADLLLAKAVFNAYYETLAHLEKALAPKPRKKAETKPAAPKQVEQKETKLVKVVRCDVCYEERSFAVHDKSMGYADYHEFVEPKSAGKKRKPKVDSSTAAEIPIENTSALAVGAD